MKDKVTKRFCSSPVITFFIFFSIPGKDVLMNCAYELGAWLLQSGLLGSED